MAKSMRSKREKRLRAIRREIVEPFYQKKDDAKMAALEAALAAPKLPVSASMQMEEQVPASNPTTHLNSMELEMADSDDNKTKASLRASGGIGKKLKKKFKLAKKKRRSGGKGKIRGKQIEQLTIPVASVLIGSCFFAGYLGSIFRFYQ